MLQIFGAVVNSPKQSSAISGLGIIHMGQTLYTHE